MNGGLYVLIRCLITFLYVADIAMLGRAVLSWFTMGEQTRVGAFLYVITEPFIMPVRALLDRIPLFQGFPLDMSFLFTYLLLSLLSMLLGGL